MDQYGGSGLSSRGGGSLACLASGAGGFDPSSLVDQSGPHSGDSSSPSGSSPGSYFNTHSPDFIQVFRDATVYELSSINYLV